MKKVIYIIFTTAIVFPILGCGSFEAHCRMPMSCQVGDPRYDTLIPIYGGVANDYDAMMDCLKAPIPGVEKKKHSEDWWVFFFFPLPIVDMPLSFVLDTIALPGDIEFWPKWSEANERRLKWEEEQKSLKKDKDPEQD